MSATLIVIPARGGSKGIPGKNLRDVGGKPLIVWTIEQALAITHPDVCVVVSTDSPEIAAVATAAGAEVPGLRPAELAQDTTPTEPVVLHALDTLESAGRAFDQVMLLQATSPVRLPGTLDRALAQFTQSGVDALVGVVPESPFLWVAHAQPPGTGATPTTLGHPSYDIANRPRRQDFDPATLPYRETGSLYVTRTSIYRTQLNRLGGTIGLFIMEPSEGLDIDEPHDLDVAAARLTR